MYVHKATASGCGEFPVDMLRYDACYPADTESAVSIALCRCSGREAYTEKRTVNLKQRGPYKLPAWQSQRWASFGWLLEPSASPPTKI